MPNNIRSHYTYIPLHAPRLHSLYIHSTRTTFKNIHTHAVRVHSVTCARLQLHALHSVTLHSDTCVHVHIRMHSSYLPSQNAFATRYMHSPPTFIHIHSGPSTFQYILVALHIAAHSAPPIFHYIRKLPTFLHIRAPAVTF